MKMQYIGTGAAEGFPGMFCRCAACQKARQAGGKNIKTRSCVLINDHILVDLSPDLYAQSLHLGITLEHVSDLVVTHTHGDHLTPFSLALRARDGATILPEVPDQDNYLSVYGNDRVRQVMETALRDQPGANPARLCYVPVEEGRWQQVGELSICPLKANHKPDERCFIYALTDGRHHCLYANDTGALSEETLDRIKALGLTFHIVSMDTARATLPGDGHMGITENMALKEWLVQEGCADADTTYVLTHLSHMSGVIHDELQEMVKPHGFTVAYDGMIVADEAKRSRT